MTPDASKPPPVLDYSTISVEGLPKWHPQAEAMIYLSKRPDALLDFFDKPRDVLRYYAMSMTRRYDQSRLEGRCVLCGGHAMEWMVRIGWRARLKNRSDGASFGLGRTDSVCKFTTLHSMCAPCYGLVRENDRRLTLWIVVLAAAFFVALAGMVIASAIQGASPSSTFASGLAVLFLVGVSIAVALERFAWRRPDALRAILVGRGVHRNGDIELLPRPIATPVERGDA